MRCGSRSLTTELRARTFPPGSLPMLKVIEKKIVVSEKIICGLFFSVIDLFDGEQYSNLSKTNAYSNVRLLTGK